MREQAELGKGMVIEEGSIPGAVASLLPVALAAASDLFGREPEKLREKAAVAAREGESLLLGAYRRAPQPTHTFPVMPHYDTQGKIRPVDDRVRVHSGRARSTAIFQ